MTQAALILAILALGIAGAALGIQQKRYQTLRRRFGMLEVAAQFASQCDRNHYTRLVEDRLAKAGRQARMPVQFTSEFGEDIALYELFEGQLEGFFIECGAHDGYIGSVSFPFEAMGWTGLLVEPAPRTNALCRARRKHAHVVQAVITRRGAAPTVKFAEITTGGLHEVSSRSYVLTHKPPKSVTEKDDRVVHDIPAITMDAALEQAKATRVDFAVIDVEGHEMDLFDGFDLDRWKPRAIMVEEYPPGQRAELISMLERRGYRPSLTVGWNRLMVRADDAQMIARCARLQWIREALRTA